MRKTGCTARCSGSSAGTWCCTHPSPFSSCPVLVPPGGSWSPCDTVPDTVAKPLSYRSLFSIESVKFSSHSNPLFVFRSAFGWSPVQGPCRNGLAKQIGAAGPAFTDTEPRPRAVRTHPVHPLPKSRYRISHSHNAASCTTSTSFTAAIRSRPWEGMDGHSRFMRRCLYPLPVTERVCSRFMAL